MKLYFNMKGSWAGTQADAKAKWGKDGWDEVDVPVSKKELIEFLEGYSCLDFEATRWAVAHRADAVREAQPLTLAEKKEVLDNLPMWHEPNHRNGPDAPINKYDIHDIAASASLKDLTQAMAVYLNRIDEELS